MATTGIDPRELRQWSAEDFAHLQASWSIQPWGPERDNAHVAMLAALYASAHTAKGKRRPSMSDYMLYSRPKVSQSAKVGVLRQWLKSTAKKSDV